MSAKLPQVQVSSPTFITTINNPMAGINSNESEAILANRITMQRQAIGDRTFSDAGFAPIKERVKEAKGLVEKGSPAEQITETLDKLKQAVVILFPTTPASDIFRNPLSIQSLLDAGIDLSKLDVDESLLPINYSIKHALEGGVLKSLWDYCCAGEYGYRDDGSSIFASSQDKSPKLREFEKLIKTLHSLGIKFNEKYSLVETSTRPLVKTSTKQSIPHLIYSDYMIREGNYPSTTPNPAVKNSDLMFLNCFFRGIDDTEVINMPDCLGQSLLGLAIKAKGVIKEKCQKQELVKLLIFWGAKVTAAELREIPKDKPELRKLVEDCAAIHDKFFNLSNPEKEIDITSPDLARLISGYCAPTPTEIFDACMEDWRKRLEESTQKGAGRAKTN